MKNKIKILLIIFPVVFAVFLAIAWNKDSWSDSSVMVKYDLSVCTDRTEQPDCYSGDFPAPVIVWDCHEESAGEAMEFIYHVQIDEQADFSSPEIDSGDFASNGNNYTVDRAGLVPGTTYYWRMKGKNPAGIWTDWAVEEDSFMASPLCGI